MELRFIFSPKGLLSSLLIALMLTLTHALQDSRLYSTSTRGRRIVKDWPESPWDSAAGVGEWALRDFRYLAPLSRDTFLPTASRCCKVGDRTARRRQQCTLAAHAVDRARAVQNAELQRLYGRRQPRQSLEARAQTRDLADKVNDCYNSPFSKNFKKCCFHRTLFMKEMNKCRRLEKGRERKQCRREVRQKYP